MSYASNYKNRKSGARFELDGDKLNNNFKGMPIDYYGNDGKQSYYDNNSGRDTSFANRQRHKENEMEDRLLSNKSVIPNFSQYVKRLDIFCVNKEELPLIKAIKSFYGSKVFIYDNLKDFDYQTDNTISVDNYNIGGLTDDPRDIRADRDNLMKVLIHFHNLINYIEDYHVKTEFFMMIKNYGLGNYINKRLMIGIHPSNRAISMEKEANELDYAMDGLSSNPFNDGQSALQMISDYMRRNKCVDIKSLARKEYSKLMQRFGK